jgi:hypothetical protein
MSALARWFDSVETDQPFSSCLVCDIPLPLTSDAWVVNKHYHHHECTLEYAVCETCRDNISKNFSTESKAAIRNFLETEIKWDERILEWMTLPDSVARLDHCVACRIPRHSIDSFTISAQFDQNGNLVENALPLLLCSHCTSKITDSLSQESLKTWRNFIAAYFDGPESDSPNLGIF